MDWSVAAFWIYRVIRLYSCDLYLSLLPIFLHYYGYYYYECISSVCYKLEQRITPHWYHWEHLYNFVLLMKGECTLCPHYEKKLLSALSIMGCICIHKGFVYALKLFLFEKCLYRYALLSLYQVDFTKIITCITLFVSSNYSYIILKRNPRWRS